MQGLGRRHDACPLGFEILGSLRLHVGPWGGRRLGGGLALASACEYVERGARVLWTLWRNLGDRNETSKPYKQ
jgi:hypothetical protein